MKNWQPYAKKGNAFPNTFRRDSLAGDLHQQYENEDGEVLKEKAIPVSVAGRIMTTSQNGKSQFYHVAGYEWKKSNFMLPEILLPEGVL